MYESLDPTRIHGPIEKQWTGAASELLTVASTLSIRSVRQRLIEEFDQQVRTPFSSR
jgi:hypothetical protein